MRATDLFGVERFGPSQRFDRFLEPSHSVLRDAERVHVVAGLRLNLSDLCGESQSFRVLFGRPSRIGHDVPTLCVLGFEHFATLLGRQQQLFDLVLQQPSFAPVHLAIVGLLEHFNRFFVGGFGSRSVSAFLVTQRLQE